MKHIRRDDEIQHSPHTRTAHLHMEQNHEVWSVVKPHGAFMRTEMVRSEAFVYSSLCTANVTFITAQMGRFNCNVCILAECSRQVMNFPRIQRVVCLSDSTWR